MEPQKHSVAVSVADGVVGQLGIGPLGQKPAILTWGDTAKVPVVLTTEAGETIFSALPKEFQKFYVEFNTIRATVNGKNFLLYSRSAAGDVAYGAGVASGAGAGASIAAGTAAFAQASVDSLKKIMGESGATINQRNPLVFGLKVFGIGFGLLVLAVFVIFAIATFS